MPTERDPSGPDEIARMQREMPALQVRAEHALLAQLARVSGGTGYPSSTEAETAANLARALADLRASTR